MSNKFTDPYITAEGDDRAYVDFAGLDNIWFNTGTVCNLTCQNCYIESSPTNDSLVYLTVENVKKIIEECEALNEQPKMVGFTGGEPFINPYFMDILTYVLSRGYDVLILTNAMKPMKKCLPQLRKLHEVYGNQVHLRVSLDHYTQAIHEKERGIKTWYVAVEGVSALTQAGMKVSIAGRGLVEEEESSVIKGYQALFEQHGWRVLMDNPSHLILFSEMDERQDVSEITTDCWDILDKKPEQMMCANSRMVVRHKGQEDVSIVACTLLPFVDAFNYGNTIKQSIKRTQLNHVFCAQFCVLGGCSCEG